MLEVAEAYSDEAVELLRRKVDSLTETKRDGGQRLTGRDWFIRRQASRQRVELLRLQLEHNRSPLSCIIFRGKPDLFGQAANMYLTLR